MTLSLALVVLVRVSDTPDPSLHPRVSASGDTAFVVWREGPRGEETLAGAVSADRGASWRALEMPTFPSRVDEPDGALGGGTFAVAFASDSGILLATRRVEEGAWSLTRVSPRGGGPRVFLAGGGPIVVYLDGGALVWWSDGRTDTLALGVPSADWFDAADDGSVAYCARAGGGYALVVRSFSRGGWGAPDTVARSRWEAFLHPSPAADAVAWTDELYAGSGIYLRSGSSLDTVRAPVEEPAVPCLALAAGVVFWTDFRADNYEIFARVGGTERRLTHQSRESLFPHAARVGDSPLVVWSDARDGNFEVYAEVLR